MLYSAPMTDILTLPYAPVHHAACISIFDGNTPAFFAPEERSDFDTWLTGFVPGAAPYLVLIRGDTVVACGGISVEPQLRQASLAWGMVARECHGLGLGSILTRARLDLARATPGVQRVVLSTSQHTRPFYERFGFEAFNHLPDGFGPGLDRWDMRLEL